MNKDDKLILETYSDQVVHQGGLPLSLFKKRFARLGRTSATSNPTSPQQSDDVIQHEALLETIEDSTKRLVSRVFGLINDHSGNIPATRRDAAKLMIEIVTRDLVESSQEAKMGSQDDD